MDDDEKKAIGRIEEKVDKLDTRLDRVDVTLAKQSVILQDHTRRSLANERAVELLRDQLQLNKEDAEKDMKPIQIHIAQIHTVFKLIGFVATLVGIITGLIKMGQWISSF